MCTTRKPQHGAMFLADVVVAGLFRDASAMFLVVVGHTHDNIGPLVVLPTIRDVH